MTAPDAISEPWILAIDTATSTVVVVAGTPAGRSVDVERFAAGHRHSERLLPSIDRLVARTGLSLGSLRGIVAGTGPGAFTGLRVGLATAKTLAHQLRIPIVGVSTAEALLASVPRGDGPPIRLWLPAGPHERLAVEPGRPPCRERDLVDPNAARTDVAVDLEDRAPEDARERGRGALEGLPGALLRLGAARLARGDVDDVERVVPEYVTPPRGMDPRLDLERGMAWSRDPR